MCYQSGVSTTLMGPALAGSEPVLELPMALLDVGKLQHLLSELPL